jgi:hypothetical protein
LHRTHQSAPKAKGATKQKGTAGLFPVSCLVFAVCCSYSTRLSLRLIIFYSYFEPKVQRKISVRKRARRSKAER